MKIATCPLSGIAHPHDGALVQVSDDLTTCWMVSELVLQDVLDAQMTESDLTRHLSHPLPFDAAASLAPLPRAYQFLDGSAYVNHVELVRRARGAEMPQSFWTDPLMYQGLSVFDGPCAAIRGKEDWGIDFEAEVAVITHAVPMGVSSEAAADAIAYVMLLNDVSLRNLIPAELAKGFGFVQSKPVSACSPVAVTADAVPGWDGRKLHGILRVDLNGEPFGRADAGVDMTFDFAQLIAHAAKTRALPAGDGIGPEVMDEVKKVIGWFGDKRGLQFDVSEELVGGCAYDAHGTPLTDETMEKAQQVDAVLLGAVGGPKYDNLDFSVKPERGLLRLRKEMDLYANLRPAQCFDALADFSSLKRDVVAGLDIMIIRELTSGVYFGEPRGIHTEGNERVGINTQRYTESEIARVARSAFELARKRNNKVCSMEKANVMESGVLWRQVVTEVHEREYPDVELSHMYADAGAMQLCRWPKQFDVIVTDNLFGDLLSDAAAMLTGSLGMLPSASLGAPMANGRPKALYEPVHGSAPDIAGQGKANPIACILSFAMALRYSFEKGDEATRLEEAVNAVLADGYRTADLLGEEGKDPVTTKQMGDAIVAALDASL